jgi:hypothetical protein
LVILDNPGRPGPLDIMMFHKVEETPHDNKIYPGNKYIFNPAADAGRHAPSSQKGACGLSSSQKMKSKARR